jgi:tetratricopeptide (TPR) repeat protein
MNRLVVMVVVIVVSLQAQVGAQSRSMARIGAGIGAGITGDVPASVLDQYHQAERLLANKDPRGAAAAIEPLLLAYPSHVALRVLSCKIELARNGAKDTRAIAACELAAGMSADIEPALTVASAQRTAGDTAGARATLVAAEERIASLAPDKATAAWLLIARQYREMNEVTRVENALAKVGAGADPAVGAWAATTRVRYGIPRDGARWKLTADDEAAAVTTVRDAVALVNASEFDAASKVIGAAEPRWPKLPGLLAARCALEFRRDALVPARQQCDRAIAQGGSSWALYLRGLIELQSGRQGATAAGIARFRAAIELDPDLVQAWQTLGRVLDRTKATAALDQLRRDYQARFGARLPN